MFVTLGMVTVTADIYCGNSGLVCGHQLVAEMDIGGSGVREARDTGTEARPGGRE